MTFDLAPAAADRRALATRVAGEVAGKVAAALDRNLVVSPEAVAALRAALPPTPGTAPVEWVVGVEALARASVPLALAAAADALGRPSLGAAAQWAGCRGLDLDGAVQALRGRPAWAHAVSATLVGAAAAMVESALEAMRTATSRERPVIEVPEIADAATAVDAARLLLWDAVHRHPAATNGMAAGMARMMALDAVRQALAVAEQLVDREALRPGAPIERLRRDVTTLAQVAGDGHGARAAVASGTLPG